MKNLLYNIQIWTMLALTMAGIQSCSDEMQDVDDAQISFTVSLPTDTHARSFGKAEQVNTLVVGVFNGEKEVIRKLFEVNEPVKLALAKNQTYSFVFWAYDNTHNIYDITDLKAIKMNALPNQITFGQAESMDAFFTVEKNITVTGSNNYPVELVRPLAQINVGTTKAPTQATFAAQSVPNTFHPFTNTVSESTNFTWIFEETTAEKLSVDGTEYNYLVMGYLFAPITGQKIKATLTMSDGNQSYEKKFQDVDIQANRRTNLAGDFTLQ